MADVKQNYPSPSFLMSDFIQYYKENFEEPIYLVIDEYDQCANEVLAKSLESFKSLTKSGGILKTFYSKIKELCSNGPIARVFITGITAIQLDSMTSGFSIEKNLINHSRFATMFGFTESELKHLKKGASEPAIASALDSAKEQAKRYSAGEAVKAIPNLKRLAIVYVGIRLATFEVF